MSEVEVQDCTAPVCNCFGLKIRFIWEFGRGMAGHSRTCLATEKKRWMRVQVEVKKIAVKVLEIDQKKATRTTPRNWALARSEM